jgi:hypothetical protein
MTTGAVIADWMRPGVFGEDLEAFVKQEPKDSLEAIGTCFEWVNFLRPNRFAENASNEVTRIKRGFSVWGFFDHLNRLRTEVRVAQKSDDFDSTRRIVNEGALTTFCAAEVALLGDSVGITPLKERLVVAHSTFWGALFLLDGINFFHQISKVKDFKKQKAEAKNPEFKDFLEHKIQHACLEVLKSVTIVAMAAISLVSHLFSSFAVGIAFEPLTMLALSTAWIVIHIANHFYGRMIERHEKGLAVGKDI